MNNLNSSEDPILFAALKPLAPGAHIVEFKEFFRFRFGDNKPRSDWEGIFPARIRPIGQDAPDEIWYTRGPVEKGINADICFVNCPHFMTSHMETFIHEDTSISEATYTAYLQLIRLAQESGYPYLARAWNFLPEILGKI